MTVRRHILIFALLLAPVWGLACRGALLDDIEIDPGPHRIEHPVKDAATHEMLRAVAGESDPVDRSQALQALARINDPATDGAVVLGLCRDPDPRLRADAWRAAAVLGLEIPADLLREGARDPAPAVRAAAFTAWSVLGSEPDPDLLAAGLEETDPAVRTAAFVCATALETDHAPLVDQLRREEDPLARLGLFRALAAAGKTDHAALIAWGLDRDDARVRAQALHSALPEDGVAGETLIALMGSPQPTLREAAVEAADRLQCLEAITHSLRLLPEADSSLRQVICHGAGVLEGTNVIQALQSVITEDTDHRVRTAALDALFQIHTPASLYAITSFLRHADTRLRVSAMERMGKWGDAEVALRLFPILDEEDPVILQTALEALLELAHPGLSDHRDRMVALAQTLEGRMAAAAIRGLGFVGHRDIIPYLHQILNTIAFEDPHQKRLAALEVLQQFENAELIARAFDLVTKRVVPPPPNFPVAGPSYDHDLVRAEALRYIARYDEAEHALTILDRIEDVPQVETRKMLIRFLKHLSGEDYEFVPFQRFRMYLVESSAPNPYPRADPPGVRRKE